ncbi:polysaccharide biosynthesis tyrosine autokinase [Pseudarthrobacter sp. YS3]|uniref:polysaccharide biosynthesis tyrosine autokinase n=1 Tax=Pseudarthrobacter sp. YS3 TaxID=3453718 RepID=UPI003EED9C0B
MVPFWWVPSAAPGKNTGGPKLDLRDYLRIIRRSWISITALTALGLLTGGLSSVLTQPTYTANTQLFVAIQSSGTVSELQQGNTFSQARVQSYVRTVTAPVVLQPVIDSLGLQETAGQLAGRVQASTDLNTVIINISVDDDSPVQAAATAQAVANSLIKAVDTLERPRTGDTSPVSLSIITPAAAPATPSAPNTRLNLALGLFVGIALGLGLAVARNTFDTRIRVEADVRRVTDAPLLGGIAFDPDATERPLLSQSTDQSPRAESFRQIRTNLQFANIAGRAKTLLLTSSLPGEGKSTTATNLAISLAQAGKNVCLIDADLRRPMVGEYLGLERNAGLTTALVGDAHINDLLQQWGEDNLYVLTSGRIPPNPSELLGSLEMSQLLQELEKAFDVVIIDAPPLLPVTDAAVLSQHVGGVVLIVGAQKAREQDLDKALQGLEMVNANLLGIVVNRLPSKGPDAYAYSYYRHEDDHRQPQYAKSPTKSDFRDQSVDEFDELLAPAPRRPAQTLRPRA